MASIQCKMCGGINENDVYAAEHRNDNPINPMSGFLHGLFPNTDLKFGFGVLLYS